MIGRMFGGYDFSTATMSFVLQQLTPFFLVMLVAGILLAGPAEGLVKRIRFGTGAADFGMNPNGKSGLSEGGEKTVGGSVILQSVLYLAAFLLLLWCLLRLSGGAYNPFIYFRF